MKMILVDGVNSTNIMFLEAFKKLGKEKKKVEKIRLSSHRIHWVHVIYPRSDHLPMFLGEGWKNIKINVLLIKVDIPFT